MSGPAPASGFSRALARDAPIAAVALGRSLRAAGLPVTPDRSVTFSAAAQLLDVHDLSLIHI